MAETSLYTVAQHPQILTRESSCQRMGKPYTADSKRNLLFVVLIILGVVGLAAAGCGIAALGSQQHWWSVGGLINRLNQTSALISVCIGGVLGTVFLTIGIVYLVKACQNSDSSHALVEDFTYTNTVSVPDKGERDQAHHLTSSAVKQCEKELINHKSDICITTQQRGGYIGYPTQRRLPEYLNNMTLEDGLALPLDPQDFFIEVALFNTSYLNNLDLPSTLCLPNALFKNKKEGDTLKLRYKDTLIMLTIEQGNHGLKYAKGNFEEVFALTSLYIKESCDVMNPYFGIFNPYWFYNLGDKGIIYKIDNSNDNQVVFPLKEGTSKELRQLIKPKASCGSIILSQDKTKLIVRIEFCRFTPEDFDIILNDNHLIVYARFENRPSSFGAADLNQKNIIQMDNNRDFWQEELGSSKEAMFAHRWDKIGCFREHSMEDMKLLLKKSTLKLVHGMFYLVIPLS